MDIASSSKPRETYISIVSDMVMKLKREKPEDHYYMFKNIFKIPEQRKFSIQVISKSAQYSFLMVSRYYSMLTVEERHLLFDSVLDEPRVCVEWFTSITSSEEEKYLLATSIAAEPKRAGELLANYPNILGETRKVLMQSILDNPLCGDIVYAKAKMTDEEFDKLIKAMVNHQPSLIKILNSYIMLGEFAREFTQELKHYAVNKIIEFNDLEAAHLINFMELIEEDKQRLTPLLVAKRLLNSK